jgi:hypothetical protein
MSGTSLTFSLQALNVEVDALKATLSGVTELDFDCDVVAGFDVPVSIMQDLFNFQSDAIDIDNIVTTDIKYKASYTEPTVLDSEGVPVTVLADGWLLSTECTGTDSVPGSENAIFFNAATAGATKRMVPHEHQRYLAWKLFRTWLGTDLFDNEEEQIEYLDREARRELNDKLVALAAAGVKNANEVDLGAEFGNFNHPSYVILQQIINDQPARLADLTPYFISGDTNGDENGNSPPWFKMPLLVDDELQFKLTIAADADQVDIIGLTPSPANAIDVRTYRIVMKLVADPIPPV